MLSFIFDRLTDPLGLPLPAWQEYFALLIIGLVAYAIAYLKTGELYRAGEIHTSIAGSFAHWGMRLLAFIVLWAVTYALITVAKVVYAHQIETLVIAFMLFFVVFVVWDVHRKQANNA